MLKNKKKIKKMVLTTIIFSGKMWEMEIIL